MAQVVRHSGQWIKIVPKPYEPDRQTHEIVWSMIVSGAQSPEVYRQWYANEEKRASVLYPSFRKEAPHGT